MLLLEDGVAVALMADSAFKQNKGKKNKNGLGSKLTPTKRAQKMPVYVSLKLGQLLDYLQHAKGEHCSGGFHTTKLIQIPQNSLF